MRGTEGGIRLVIFDVDGTLVTTRSGRPRRQAPADWKLLPGRRDAIRALLDAGIHVAIATNQGAVAFGIYTEDAIRTELERTLARLAGRRAAEIPLLVAFNHPRGRVPGYDVDSDRRKPGGGMLREAMAHFGVTPGETLMVGDMPDDEGAARAAGTHFAWADDFFRSLRRTGPDRAVA